MTTSASAASFPADPWPAPTPSAPLDATVVVPGSKSQMNRALPLAALASEPTTITGALDSRDSDLMIAALRALGTSVSVSDDRRTVHVEPRPLRGPAAIDCGLAGTVMRFLPPIAALADGPITLDGDPAARVRPMGPVLQALADLGVEVTGTGASTAGGDGPGYLPCVVHGRGGVDGGDVAVDASGSSQFVSSLLLAAPRFGRGITVTHVGERLPSVPHITMTVEAMRARGVRIDDSRRGRWRVEPGPIAGGEVAIEPDLSNAGPFLAAALAAGGTVRVPGWPSATAQPGDLLRDLLTRMGAEVELAGGTLTVRGTGEPAPLVADLSLAGELTPTLAALCTLAEGTSRLTGVAHLRGHETDRLAALVTEITRLGAEAEELPDGLVIHGGRSRLRGAVMETYADHRMATFAAIIGLAVPDVRIRDVATTRKTIADFPALWTGMLRGA
ncbi:3-phosphoshikimate 1-carboxyvinyltransferase [Pseudactinotalea sp. HY158]|uniref:3-phosphoshikimate 1-carboxyvinyltransferase n=1 Tax=Pseudactinotalea sp. HY158 TaxID=2654547 RepID=UPI00129CB8F3|nr:3-phosphoshikimate 1-carboxyvinyltransferase [Pseudactinotalea sp. HY158]QGH68867.1 3-phosphoshikimate 1-carboxyvinyltransferase [Pseudactinotalea sp. HY158]